MSMFRTFQLVMRNALSVAKGQMSTTTELHLANLAIVNLLSERRHESLFRGEEVLSTSPEVVVNPASFTVAALSLTPGVVTFQPYSYEYALLINDVVLEGHLVSWQLVKTYPAAVPPVPPATFGPNDLRLLTDNFQLVVTIQPGGTFIKAAVLQEITMG